MLRPVLAAVFSFLTLASTVTGAESGLSYQSEPGGLRVRSDGQQLLTYVFADSTVRRPYFTHVHAPDGTPLTRIVPPIVANDSDHPTIHPGAWLAFGDISGHDFWRTKEFIEHRRFVERVTAKGERVSFAVENIYRTQRPSQELCRELNRVDVRIRPAGTLVILRSTFYSTRDEFRFGDQEEMGLGVRVASPLRVTQGGQIIDSQGRVNERGVWGKQADWCDYGKVIDGRRVGITVMPGPGNFRPSWFHVRDYGVLVANPFGRAAFKGGPPSSVVVKRGQSLTLVFGLLLHSNPEAETDLAAAYRDFLAELGGKSNPPRK